MRYWLAAAAMGAVLVTGGAWAQRGGGGHGGGFAGHGGGFAGHGGFAGRSAMGGGMRSSGGFHGGGFRHSGQFGFGHPDFGHGRFFHHHHFNNSGFFPWWGWGWGFPWWGWDYGSFDDNSYGQPTNEYDYQAAYYAQNMQLQQQQQEEIGRLSDEVANLRQQQERQQRPASPSSSAAAKPTELIFRDKRVEEVQNYAIAGQTLWILTEQRARRIPLSELDIVATKKANEDRGIDFELPR